MRWQASTSACNAVAQPRILARISSRIALPFVVPAALAPSTFGVRIAAVILLRVPLAQQRFDPLPALERAVELEPQLRGMSQPQLPAHLAPHHPRHPLQAAFRDLLSRRVTQHT